MKIMKTESNTSRDVVRGTKGGVISRRDRGGAGVGELEHNAMLLDKKWKPALGEDNLF